MKLRIPNSYFWSVAVALTAMSCGGDSSPTAPSSQPGTPSAGNFSLSVEVSNTSARASTALSQSVGWAQRQEEDEVQIGVVLSEKGGQTGATIDAVGVKVVNAKGRAIRSENVRLTSNRIGPGASMSLGHSLPRLNTNAQKIEVTANLTTDTGASISVSDEASAPFPKNCANSDTNLCLNNSRFHIYVEWENILGELGVGHKASQHDYRGEFWFFDPKKVDLRVDVLNGCSTNHHFWVGYNSPDDFVYGSDLSRLVLTVTDTVTGDAQVYSNPPDGFEPIQDTSAFATCP